jgi:hypothetical protein
MNVDVENEGRRSSSSKVISLLLLIITSHYLDFCKGDAMKIIDVDYEPAKYFHQCKVT